MRAPDTFERKSPRAWTVAEAKARLSEVLRRSADERITRATRLRLTAAWLRLYPLPLSRSASRTSFFSVFTLLRSSSST